MNLLTQSKSISGLNQVVYWFSTAVCWIYSMIFVGDMENDSLEANNTFCNVNSNDCV